MKQTIVKKLLVQRVSLLKEVAAHPGFVRGSLIRTTRSGKDGSRREFRFLSRRIAGVNHSIYVPGKKMRAFEAATRLYRRTSVLIEKICAINIRIIRAGGKP